MAPAGASWVSCYSGTDAIIIALQYGRRTELLHGRDDADTDVSDHRGDETGRENVAKVKFDADATL